MTFITRIARLRSEYRNLLGYRTRHGHVLSCGQQDALADEIEAKRDELADEMEAFGRHLMSRSSGKDHDLDVEAAWNYYGQAKDLREGR